MTESGEHGPAAPARTDGPGGSGPAPAEADEISYEQARDELTAVVLRLETGGLTLEESLELWERGEQLADVCAEWLEGARARLTAAISARSGPAGPGGSAAAPF